MLKQTVVVRNNRDKGVKVKHVLQVFILLGICFWLLNQIRHSYNNKQAYDDGNGSISEKVGVKLGRKDLNPKVESEEEEVEEIKPELEGDDEGRGGGDDEIDGRDQEKNEEEETEEVQEMVDEEDREKENQIEDLSLAESQVENEGDDEDSQEAREENYKGDDASSAVLQKGTNVGTEI